MLKKDFNIKKNLLRVKQLADQGLGRAEKTEVLTEDLQAAEKRVEMLKTVLQSLVRKLTSSLQAHSVQDAEKRMKKMPIAHLAQCLDENGSLLGEGALSEVLSLCGSRLQAIGYAQSTYELILEKATLAFFQQLLEVDIPAIKKSKQLLSKLTLDMDATRSRQQAASKESSHHPSNHNQMKSDSLSNTLEEAEHKVNACKDQYATEMFTLISKESEICQKVVEWMDAQVSYHRSCLTHLEDLLPDVKSMIGQSLTKPIYGCPLDEHLQSTGKDIAVVIEACISILYHEGLEEEGLFRIAGSTSKLKKLKAAFNVGTLADMDEYYTDLHVVAGALKQYIRELPEPLLTFDLFDEFLQCMAVKERDARLQRLWSVVNKLPKSNFANVRYLIKFLAKLADKSDVNKMTPSNIAIVFGPNLLWKQNDSDGANVVLSTVQNQVVETLVQHHQYFFPGDVKFADMETLTASFSDKSSKSKSSQSLAQRATSNEETSSNSTVAKTQGDDSLSASQHSLSSNDSSANSLSHSPSINRKGKKPAPPPPPTFSPSLAKESPFKPERPEGRPERRGSVHVQKPGCPPPAVPSTPSPAHSQPSPDFPPPSIPPTAPSQSLLQKTVSRPLNPPPTPPTPADTQASPKSTNPFLDDESSSLPPISEKHGAGIRKTHARNPSADIPITHTPTEVKGHNRTKSHDLKMRQPPPIPQRTHSIPSKHSSENKAATPSGGIAADSKPPDGGGNVLNCLVDLSPVEIRDRMNSVTDATPL